MPVTIHAAYASHAAGNAPMRLAVHEGYFAQRGIDLVMIKAPRGADAIKMLEAGEVDVTAVSGLPIIRAVLRGFDPLIVMSIENQNVFAIMGTHGVTGPGDLAGATVGVSGPDDQDGIMMRRALRDWNIDPATDLTMVTYDGGRGALWPALLNGEISAMAATIPEPIHARAVGIPILRDFMDLNEPYQAGSLIVRRSFADDNPELLHNLLTAQLSGIRAFHDDFDLALPHLRECTRIDNVDVLRETNRLFGEAMLHYLPSEEPLLNVVRDVREITGDPIDIDVSKIVEPSFAERLG